MAGQVISLADRMKAYEGATGRVLVPRMPVILRVDGKAFHTYTRGCERPFDLMFNMGMDQVALDLVRLIQGAEMAYVQSDEVSVLINPYRRFVSQCWFNGKVQKMTSVSAAQAAVTMTMYSNRIFGGQTRPALFDSRVFNVPAEDVPNYFVWRQNDAERNSVQMLARALFGHKAILSKGVREMRKMCKEDGNAWEKQDQRAISGGLVRKVDEEAQDPSGMPITRSIWKVTPARNLLWRDVVRPRLATDE